MVQELLKARVTPRQITLHVDSDTDRSYDALEANAGYTFPIVKLRNTVYHFAQIKLLQLEVGKQFVPTITVVIDDARKIMVDQDPILRKELMTVYIGNSKNIDATPIHMDFEVINFASSMGNVYTVHGKMVIPNALSRKYSATVATTSFESIKELCQTMQLGFVSNIKGSNDSDKRTWLFNGRTNIEMLKYLIDCCWIDDNSYTYAFIDQYYRLNLIELNRAFDEPAEDRQVTKNIITQEDLEIPERLVLSTSLFDYTNTQFRIVDWHPINPLGDAERYLHRAVNHIVYQKNYDTNELSINSAVSFIESDGSDTAIDTVGSGIDVKTLDHFAATHIDTQEVDPPYDAGIHNDMGRALFMKSPHIQVQLQSMTQDIGLFEKVPVDIRNSPYRHDQQLQDNDINQLASNDAEQVTAFNDDVNITYSGEYLVTGLSIEYNKRSQKLQNTFRLHKRLWQNQNPLTD